MTGLSVSHPSRHAHRAARLFVACLLGAAFVPACVIGATLGLCAGVGVAAHEWNRARRWLMDVDG